jgi:hypothetical protein
MTSEATPFHLPHMPGVTYHKYVCAGCGKTSRNIYSEPNRSQMLERRLCWECNYWRNHKPKVNS